MIINGDGFTNGYVHVSGVCVLFSLTSVDCLVNRSICLFTSSMNASQFNSMPAYSQAPGLRLVGNVHVWAEGEWKSLLEGQMPSLCPFPCLSMTPCGHPSLCVSNHALPLTLSLLTPLPLDNHFGSWDPGRTLEMLKNGFGACYPSSLPSSMHAAP